jgi:hypothetical protein
MLKRKRKRIKKTRKKSFYRLKKNRSNKKKIRVHRKKYIRTKGGANTENDKTRSAGIRLRARQKACIDECNKISTAQTQEECNMLINKHCLEPFDDGNTKTNLGKCVKNTDSTSMTSTCQWTLPKNFGL